MMFIINKLIAATRYSLQGLKALFHLEFAFRLELIAVIVLTCFILWIDAELISKLVLFSLLMLLLIIEAINSAIEATVNRISEDIHPLAKRAKDMGSAAVFLTILLNVI